MASSEPSRVSVLFVCLGNICRSTMAEGVFRHLVKTNVAPANITFHIDSAGTAGYHVGDAPDSRTMATLRKHNITNYHHYGRQLRSSDFTQFDYIMAMDMSNLRDILHAKEKAMRSSSSSSSSRSKAKVAEVRLFGDFAAQDGSVPEKVGAGSAVPDPYYGGSDGFETVFQMVTQYSLGFLQYLVEQQKKGR
ncbi:hypothetical protein KEM54_006043 [Ascosphaera aggregata]|nr:hypothetical protein KEM54_006043 [Ascosphaera aggregata]